MSRKTQTGSAGLAGAAALASQGGAEKSDATAARAGDAPEGQGETAGPSEGAGQETGGENPADPDYPPPPPAGEPAEPAPEGAIPPAVGSPQAPPEDEPGNSGEPPVESGSGAGEWKGLVRTLAEGDGGSGDDPLARRPRETEPGTQEEAGLPPHGALALSDTLGRAGYEKAVLRRPLAPSLLGMPILEESPPMIKKGPDKPSVGRIVHYVLQGGCNAGQTRAAMVTRTQDDWTGGTGMTVNLNVFCDRATDYSTNTPEEFTKETPYDEDGAPGTWRWPARS